MKKTQLSYSRNSKYYSIIVCIFIFLISFVSAQSLCPENSGLFGWAYCHISNLWEKWFGGEVVDTLDPKLTEVNLGKQWIVTEHNDINEELFDVKVNNLENGKAKICFIPKKDMPQNSKDADILTATIKQNQIETKQVQPADFEKESEKGNLKQICYDVDSTNEDYIRFGEHSTVLAYQDVNILNYDIGFAQANITLFKNISNEWINNVPEIFVYYNENNYKFGATDNGANETELNTYLYNLKSTTPIYKEGNILYVQNPEIKKTKGLNSFTYYENHDFDFTDICSRGFEEWNTTEEIDGENYTITHYNKTANCEFNSYEEYIDENTTFYYYNVTFLSDKNIDPIITISDSDWISTSTLTNVTAESGANNFTHLNLSIFQNELRGFDLVRRDSILPYAEDDNNSYAVFDGDGDYVDTNSDFTSLEGSTEMTISAWVKNTPINIASGANERIVSKDGAGADSFNLMWGTAERIIFYVYNDTTSAYSRVNILSDNNWHHYVGVYNGTNVLTYDNGVLQTEMGSLTGGVQASAHTVQIGGTTAYFNGSIDDVMIFNRSLSDAEIASLYSLGRKQTTYTDASLISEYRFDNSSDATAIDEWGGNDGTFNNDAEYGYDLYGLESYYPFDGDLENTEGTTSYDFTGNNDGVYNANAVSNLTCGLYDNGACFNGNDYVDIGNFIMDLAQGFTVMAWAKTDTVSAENQFFGIGGESSSGSLRARFQIGYYSDGKYRVLFRNNANQNIANIYNAGSEMDDNQWHQFVFVFDKENNLITAYTDLTAIYNTTPSASTSFITTDHAVMGGNYLQGSVTANFNGELDELMVFNRPLSTSEITDIFNNQSARFLSTGRQDITDQTYLNISTGNNRVNVSTIFQNLKGSEINLSVGYYDGTWHYTDPQTISAGVNETFIISDTSTNLTLNYTFVAGDYQFYTPILDGDISFEAWNSGAEDTSFTVSLPFGYTQINFSANNKTVSNLNMDGQDSENSGIEITNTGNQNLNISMILNQSLDGFVIFFDTDNNPNGAITLTTSAQLLKSSLASSSSQNLWGWVNWTDKTPQTNSSQLNVTSEIS